MRANRQRWTRVSARFPPDESDTHPVTTSVPASASTSATSSATVPSFVIDTGLGPAQRRSGVRGGKETGWHEAALSCHHPRSPRARPRRCSPFRPRPRSSARADQVKDIAEFGLQLAKVFASRSAINAELLKDADFRKADVTFERNYDLDLGGRTAHNLHCHRASRNRYRPAIPSSGSQIRAHRWLFRRSRDAALGRPLRRPHPSLTAMARRSLDRAGGTSSPADQLVPSSTAAHGRRLTARLLPAIVPYLTSSVRTYRAQPAEKRGFGLAASEASTGTTDVRGFVCRPSATSGSGCRRTDRFRARLRPPGRLDCEVGRCRRARMSPGSDNCRSPQCRSFHAAASSSMRRAAWPSPRRSSCRPRWCWRCPAPAPCRTPPARGRNSRARLGSAHRAGCTARSARDG